jgi:salicylate hydroxylase
MFDSLTQFLSYVDKVDKWKLMHRTTFHLVPIYPLSHKLTISADAEMTTWINPSSTLVFVYVTHPAITIRSNKYPSGDACHPMLPYLAQGANSSLEDGAVLGGLLGHMKSKSQLPAILRLYETLRKERGEAIVRETFKQVRYFPTISFQGELREEEEVMKGNANANMLCSATTSTCPTVPSRRSAMRSSARSWIRMGRLKARFRVGGAYTLHPRAPLRVLNVSRFVC